MKILNIQVLVQSNGDRLIVGLGDDMFCYEYHSIKGQWVRMNDEHPFIFDPNSAT